MYLAFAILVLVGVVAGAPTASIKSMDSTSMYLMPDGKLHMSQAIEPFQHLPSFFPSALFMSSISKPIESVMLDKSKVKVGEKDFVTIPSGPGLYYALPLINEEKPKMPGMESRSNIESIEEDTKEMPEDVEEAEEIAEEEGSEEKLIEKDAKMPEEMDEKFEEPENDAEMPEEMDEKFEEPENDEEMPKEMDENDEETDKSAEDSDLLSSFGIQWPISWPISWPSWLPHLPVSLPGLSSSPARMIYYPENRLMYYIPTAAPIEAVVKKE